MSGAAPIVGPMFELLESSPRVRVEEAEYRRLLGYPPDHAPGPRAEELAGEARSHYAEHGRPWVYLREVELYATDDTLRIDGVEFHSRALQRHLREAGAVRAVLVAASAGRACEERARRLWEEAKPDEYFFLEVFGSAVVEHLVSGVSGRICELAERSGLMAVPHYSPGYTGWDVSDQNKLFELIARGLTQPLPEPLAVLPSGMLNPKKSLLAVVGLAARTGPAAAGPRPAPCASCAFSPCSYRRAPYRHAAGGSSAGSVRDRGAPARAPGYTVNRRALQKWSRERVRLDYGEGGAVEARFRFDGTTCSNLGRPLAFDYRVSLRASADGYTIVESDCRPAPDDEGHRFMCAYLSDGEALMAAVAGEKPLVGGPLDRVLSWERAAAPSGCHCTADSRAHKWGLALEVIHFALAQDRAAAPQPDSS